MIQLFVSSTVKKIQFSLIILLLGVGIATVTDLQLNILAVLTTCAAQIVSYACLIFSFPFPVLADPLLDSLLLSLSSYSLLIYR